MGTTQTTDASFQTDVLGSDKPVLVDFWAEWCAPCRMIAPALEEIADELGDRVSIVKLNITDHPEAASQQGVQSIPLLKLFKNGQPVAELLGARPKSQLKAWLESELA